MTAFPFSGPDLSRIGQKAIGSFSRAVYLLSMIAAAVLVVRFAAVTLKLPNIDLLSWDQAARADEVLQMAQELRRFDLAAFIVHVFSVNWWPPLGFLIFLPFSLILGPSVTSFLIPSFLAFPLVVLSLLFLYRFCQKKGPSEESGVGLSLLFGLAVTSPFLLGCSSWVMLEIFGLLMIYLAFACYFRARQSGRVSHYRLSGILIFILWTLKYNYGLFVTVILIVSELMRSREFLRERLFSMRIIRSFFKMVYGPIYILLGLIMFVALTGGVKVVLLGHTISITNIYNPVLYLYDYSLLTALWRFRKNWKEIIPLLQVGQRELVLWGLLPIGVFLGLPDKIKAILQNFEAGQRTSSGFSLEGFVYYLRSLSNDYFLFLPLGILTLSMFVIGLIKIKRGSLCVRSMAVFFFLGYVLLSLSFNLRESRYLSPFVPALWLVSAWTADHLSMNLPRKTKAIAAGLISISAAAVSIFTPLVVNKAAQQPWAGWFRHDESFRSAVDPVLLYARDTQTILVFGAQDLDCHPLLAWKLRSSQFKKRDFRFEIVDSGKRPNRERALSQVWPEAKVETVAIFIVRKGSMEKELSELARWLQESSAYELLDKEAHELPKSFVLLVFRKINH
jgi:hypothetical protein